MVTVAQLIERGIGIKLYLVGEDYEDYLRATSKI